MKKFPHIFSPYKIKNTTFKNRIFAAPVITNRGNFNGVPTMESIYVHENRARGGFAQVTISESFVDFEFAARHDMGLDLVSPDFDRRNVDYITLLTDSIKAHGAIASIQLNHSGHVNHPNMLDGKNPIGPSHFVLP